MKFSSRRSIARAVAVAMSLSAFGLFMPSALAVPSLSQPGQDINEQMPRGEADVENVMPAAPSENEEIKFTLKNINLDAPDLRLNKEKLTGILSPALNREITLGELNSIIDQVTAYCRSHGYPASAAFVPAQQVAEDGTIHIQVIPGRYGKVIIDNHSRLKDDIIQGFINNLKPGNIIETESLETALFSISDLSGTKAVAVLAAGSEFGTSDVTVRVEDGKQSNTVLYTENYGSRSSGRYRYGLQESIYDVGGTGGKINLGTLISNSRMHNFYANYEALVGRGGTTLGIGYSKMDYQLGGPVGASLHPEGTANTLSIFGSTPIFHTTSHKMKVTYGYDYRRMKDEFDENNLSSFMNRKKHSHSAHVGVEGFERWTETGTLLNYDLSLRSGRLGLDSTTPYGKLLDDATNAEGGYTKLEANLTGVQALGHRTDVMVKLSGQRASKNLDGSEQIYLGGANGVRAYPQAEGAGDDGWLGTIEFRYYTDLPGLVLSTYLDGGHVNLRHDGSYGGETLKGWGIGVSYTKPNDWFARFDYARRIGSDPHMSDEAKSRARMWFILGKIW